MFLIFNSCWQSEVYTTHIGPFDKSLFIHEPPSVKFTPHSPPLPHQEDGTEEYKFIHFSGSINWHCVFHFSILVSVDPQKCSLVQYASKHGVAHNLKLHSQHLNFVFVFLAEYTAPNALILHMPVSVVACVMSFQFAWGWSLSSLACLQNAKVGNCTDMGWHCLSWPTWTPCKRVDYRYSSLTVCTVSNCVNFVQVTSSVWLSVSLSLGAEMS